VHKLKIKLEYLGHVTNMTGNARAEEIAIKNDSSVVDLLNTLAQKYGEPFKKAVYEPGFPDLKSNYIATVNGQLLNQLNGINTKLKDGDHLTIMPIVSGG
jgi:MoaD family protein